MKNDLPPLLLDADGARAALGGISRDHLDRLVSTGKLPVVRLPGRRDSSGRGTTETSRRVLYAVEDLQRLIDESKESASQETPAASAEAKLRLGSRRRTDAA